jgi:hypothetical protein
VRDLPLFRVLEPGRLGSNESHSACKSAARAHDRRSGWAIIQSDRKWHGLRLRGGRELEWHSIGNHVR